MPHMLMKGEQRSEAFHPPFYVGLAPEMLAQKGSQERPLAEKKFPPFSISEPLTLYLRG